MKRAEQNAMEFDALDNIAKILEDLPEESHAKSAFRNVVELAMLNVKMQRHASQADLLEEERKHSDRLSKELAMVREDWQTTQTRMEERIQELHDTNYSLAEKVEVIEEANKLLQDNLDKAETEVLRLKAKLYDMMTAEEE